MSGVVIGCRNVWEISEMKVRKNARWMTTGRFMITFYCELAAGTNLLEQLASFVLEVSVYSI